MGYSTQLFTDEKQNHPICHLACYLIHVLCFVFKSDDNAEPEQTEQTKEVRKNMSVEVSYSGDFSSGFFVLIINGVITKADSLAYVAPLIDERDDKAYTTIQLNSKETTTAQALKFHSKDKVAGIMVTGGVTDDDYIDGITNIKVRVKVYSNDKLIDDHTILTQIIPPWKAILCWLRVNRK